MKDGYKWVGFQYEFTGNIYSLGRIPQCKKTMLKHLKPGQKLLVAGAGHGTEAIEAAQMGVDVTAVDLSATMLKHLNARLDKCSDIKEPMTCVNDDIFNIQDTEKYDMVIANFFLNVFPEKRVDEVANHLATLVKPGGYFVVGEFMLPEKGIMGLLQKIYWYIAILLYSVTTEAVLHPVHDYAQLVRQSGCDIQDVEYFSVLGLKLYWSILGKKSNA
jgi:demethylmenaquinone methyltransferase/2-methoxy-6-polyprenyl-1,4-benzoquinol methylase